ncbi:16784_t:CDS:2, partial [Funneliformis mosseae]
YISRFRNPEKLQSEAGYYLSSLMGAISFIENMDVSSLSITQDEFDKNIEITMKELEKEWPEIPKNTREISYDNVMHPSR